MTDGDRLLRAHEPDQAEQQYRQALAALRHLHAPGGAVATVVLNLGRALRDRGKDDEAVQTFREALVTARSGRPTNTVRSTHAQAAELLAIMLWYRGDRGDELFRLIAESAQVRRELHGPDDLRVASPLLRLAQYVEETGRFEQAIEATAGVARIARFHREDTSSGHRGAEAHLATLRARAAAPR